MAMGVMNEKVDDFLRKIHKIKNFEDITYKKDLEPNVFSVYELTNIVRKLQTELEQVKTELIQLKQGKGTLKPCQCD
jgi:uncharacterized small protein (DUF1192 family)